MTAILEALKANGIPERDVQTRLFSIQPQYTWREGVGPRGERMGEQVLVGYIASSIKMVKVRDLGMVGKVIDDAVAAGGDLVRVQGVRFTVEDLSPYQSQARERAVQDALARARQFAQLTGVTLGKPVFITEAVPAPAPAAPTPIVGGEREIEVTVQVVFAIQ